MNERVDCVLLETAEDKIKQHVKVECKFNLFSVHTEHSMESQATTTRSISVELMVPHGSLQTLQEIRFSGSLNNGSYFQTLLSLHW